MATIRVDSDVRDGTPNFLLPCRVHVKDGSATYELDPDFVIRLQMSSEGDYSIEVRRKSDGKALFAPA